MVESYERKKMANKNRGLRGEAWPKEALGSFTFSSKTGSSPFSSKKATKKWDVKKAMKKWAVKMIWKKGASPLVSVQNGTSSNVGKAPSAPPPKK